jgi:hypothetical protein
MIPSSDIFDRLSSTLYGWIGRITHQKQRENGDRGLCFVTGALPWIDLRFAEIAGEDQGSWRFEGEGGQSRDDIVQPL